jgi:glutamate-1-semialdehyde 2,1-aminomutase
MKAVTKSEAANSEVAAVYPDATSRSAQLYDRALASLPGGNSRTAVFREPYPIYINRGEGAYVWDVDGVKRLDLINNQSALVHGHSHPHIVKAVKAQVEKLTSVCAPTESEVVLAEELCRRVRSIERVSFCNSGSEAVLFAVRAARAHTGRDIVAKVEGSYHGNIDAVEISVFPKPNQWGDASAPQAQPEGLGIPTHVVENTLVLPFNDVDAARRLIQEHASQLACVLIDPAPPRMGFIEASDSFLQMLREETKRHGIVLIFDEVYAFRQSMGGAQQRRGVDADLTALGKLIGGGLPIGATAGSAEILSVFDPRNGGAKAGHAGTFNANPLSMVAGRAALDLLNQDMFEHLDALGERAREGLRGALSDAGIPGVVNGVGSLFSMLIGHDGPLRDVRRITEAMSSARPDGRTPRELGVAYARHLINDGFIGAMPSTFVLSTAMTAQDIDNLVAASRVALKKLSRV